MHKSLKSKALYFLSKREYSYKELFNKLQKYTDNNHEIEDLLTEMQVKGWLSEERYINNYILTKSKRYGLVRIKQNLLQKTVNPDLVDKVIAANAIDEYNVAYRLWQKKFASRATNPIEIQKQIRYLYNKGFSFSIIKKIILNVDELLEDG